MTAIFDVLPGIEVPVAEIASSLARMWDDRAEAGQPAPAADEVKATQVNFVLHFGFATTPDDAERQFRTTVRFSTRYPSRVVVLCPLPPGDPATDMRAKIYGECFLGRIRSDARCCEFVLLCYPMSARGHLENQVSVCLSPDLPLYRSKRSAAAVWNCVTTTPVRPCFAGVAMSQRAQHDSKPISARGAPRCPRTPACWPRNWRWARLCFSDH